MTVDGVIAHEQAFRYGLIVQPFGDESKNLDFTFCQATITGMRVGLAPGLR